MPKDPTNRRDIIIWPEWTPWPISPCCLLISTDISVWELNENIWELDNDNWES
jgi:hypothetical protein